MDNFSGVRRGKKVRQLQDKANYKKKRGRPLKGEDRRSLIRGNRQKPSLTGGGTEKRGTRIILVNYLEFGRGTKKKSYAHVGTKYARKKMRRRHDKGKKVGVGEINIP